MPSQSRIRTLALIFGLAATLANSAAAAEVSAAPGQIEFKSVKEAATIKLTADGAPVPASAVESVKLYVDRHDYDHMIQVGKADGQITIRPTDMLELGTYDLVIDTAHGKATVKVLALLEIVDTSLDARAARQGVTVEAIKAQLGISQPVGQERIDLNLPGLYYIGQSMEVNLPVQAGRTALWSVNGEEIAPRNGQFRYVFEQAGVYDFGYVEKVEGRTVAVGLGTVTAAAEPKVPVRVQAGTQLSLHAPAGYGKFQWTVDDNAAEGSDTWSGNMDDAGSHTVTVRASEPKPDTPHAFRVVTYAIEAS